MAHQNKLYSLQINLAKLSFFYICRYLFLDIEKIHVENRSRDVFLRAVSAVSTYIRSRKYGRQAARATRRVREYAGAGADRGHE